MSSGGNGALRCLLVRAGDHLCALPIASVKRVLRSLTVYPLPGAAAELIGMAEFGGEPLPVLDLARLVQAPAGATATHPVTIVVSAGPPAAREVAGLAADAALDIVDVPLDRVTGQEGGVVRGDAVVRGQAVRLLDLEALGGAS